MVSVEFERKTCINCSMNLETEDQQLQQSAFYTLNCSSRVRSPFSPATVELIPVPHALATIFNIDTLEKVSKVSDLREKSLHPKDFKVTASNIPICFVCYLVLSDLYKIYTEFSQLRKANSFLGSKLLDLENSLKGQQNQSQKTPQPQPIVCITPLRASNSNNHTSFLDEAEGTERSRADDEVGVEIKIEDCDNNDSDWEPGADVDMDLDGVTEDEEGDWNDRRSRSMTSASKLATPTPKPTQSAKVDQVSSSKISNSASATTARKRGRGRPPSRRVAERLEETKTKSSSSSNPEALNQNQIKRVRVKKEYKLIAAFDTLEEARNFVKQEGVWVYKTRRPTPHGERFNYFCRRFKSSKTCRSSLYILQGNEKTDDDSDLDLDLGLPKKKMKLQLAEAENSNPIKVYKSTLEHTCSEDEEKKRGVSPEVRAMVDKLFQRGLHTTKLIQNKLIKHGVEVQKMQLNNYVARLRRNYESETTNPENDSKSEGPSVSPCNFNPNAEPIVEQNPVLEALSIINDL